jgi:alkylation response protein AidB-like acyl-CoA dehydrogenase
MHDAILPTPTEVRAAVTQFVAERWDPQGTVGAWWAALAEAGYASPMLPPEHGGLGYPRDLAAIVNRALADAEVVGPPAGIGLMLAAPTISAHGTPEQIRRFLPPILDGRHGWCQLFSEPGAGSDLAGLQARAERDGDEWVVSGQKVWTSTGQHADWGMLLARTDPDLPKHQGITWFAFPMAQEGVEVRPLREMTGRAMFNEVFLDGARVHQECVIGEVGDGWRVANTTLMVERAGIGGGGGDAFGAAIPGSIAGHLPKRAGDFLGRRSAAGAAKVDLGLVRELASIAAERGELDEVTRQDLARLLTEVELTRLLVARAREDAAVAMAVPNIAKLRMSHSLRLARDVASRVVGAGATLWGPDAPTGGAVQELTVFSPAPSIYGGSDEVQRNILGERVLGLPKEPGPSKDTPFRDLLQNPTR